MNISLCAISNTILFLQISWVRLGHHFWRVHEYKFYFLFNWIWCIWQLFFGESRYILSFILIKIRFYTTLGSASMIEIHFTWYVENVKLFLSQKSQFDLVEKIKNKNRTRASLFQSSEDRKQEFFMWPISTPKFTGILKISNPSLESLSPPNLNESRLKGNICCPSGRL